MTTTSYWTPERIFGWGLAIVLFIWFFPTIKEGGRTLIYGVNQGQDYIAEKARAARGEGGATNASTPMIPQREKWRLTKENPSARYFVVQGGQSQNFHIPQYRAWGSEKFWIVVASEHSECVEVKINGIGSQVCAKGEPDMNNRPETIEVLGATKEPTLVVFCSKWAGDLSAYIDPACSSL